MAEQSTPSEKDNKHSIQINLSSVNPQKVRLPMMFGRSQKFAVLLGQVAADDI
jgi:hypothetical protein